MYKSLVLYGKLDLNSLTTSANLEVSRPWVARPTPRAVPGPCMQCGLNLVPCMLQAVVGASMRCCMQPLQCQVQPTHHRQHMLSASPVWACAVSSKASTCCAQLGLGQLQALHVAWGTITGCMLCAVSCWTGFVPWLQGWSRLGHAGASMQGWSSWSLHESHPLYWPLVICIVHVSSPAPFSVWRMYWPQGLLCMWLLRLVQGVCCLWHVGVDPVLHTTQSAGLGRM